MVPYGANHVLLCLNAANQTPLMLLVDCPFISGKYAMLLAGRFLYNKYASYWPPLFLLNKYATLLAGRLFL
jgi:hypothetical protein